MTREGCVSGINRTVMTSHTIADVFQTHLKGYSNYYFVQKKVGAQVTHRVRAHVPTSHLPPGHLYPQGRIQSKILYNYFFLFISPLLPYTSSDSDTPPVSSIGEAPWGTYRSTPSAFLTHFSTHLVPVKPIAPLMVQNFIKALCRHAAFGLLSASFSYYTILSFQFS